MENSFSSNISCRTTLGQLIMQILLPGLYGKAISNISCKTNPGQLLVRANIVAGSYENAIFEHLLRDHFGKATHAVMTGYGTR